MCKNNQKKFAKDKKSLEKGFTTPGYRGIINLERGKGKQNKEQPTGATRERASPAGHKEG